MGGGTLPLIVAEMGGEGGARCQRFEFWVCGFGLMARSAMGTGNLPAGTEVSGPAGGPVFRLALMAVGFSHLN